MIGVFTQKTRSRRRIRRPGIHDCARDAELSGSRFPLLRRRSCSRRDSGIWASRLCGRLRHFGDDRSPGKVSDFVETAVMHLLPRAPRTDSEYADSRQSLQGRASHAALTGASPIKAAEGGLDFSVCGKLASLCLREPFEHCSQMGWIDRFGRYLTPRQLKNGAGDVIRVSSGSRRTASIACSRSLVMHQ